MSFQKSFFIVFIAMVSSVNVKAKDMVKEQDGSQVIIEQFKPVIFNKDFDVTVSFIKDRIDNTEHKLIKELKNPDNDTLQKLHENSQNYFNGVVNIISIPLTKIGWVDYYKSQGFTDKDIDLAFKLYNTEFGKKLLKANFEAANNFHLSGNQSIKKLSDKLSKKNIEIKRA